MAVGWQLALERREMSLRSQIVLGITPGFDEGVKLPAAKQAFYLRREYTRTIAETGALPLVITPDMHMDQILALCDGIVLSGGEDIPAEVYGGEQLLTVPEPLERIMWERMLIDRCDAAGVPILGVCYGMQLLALHYGGALYQDIHSAVPASIEHSQTVHAVQVTQGFLGLERGDELRVASRHHQAVATLPDRFNLCAAAPDGIIEAMSNGRIFGVQWHPESDDTGRILYKTFVERCITASARH